MCKQIFYFCSVVPEYGHFDAFREIWKFSRYVLGIARITVGLTRSKKKFELIGVPGSCRAISFKCYS